MRILIAEDDPISCCVLKTALRKWGHEVVVTVDGRTASEILLGPDAPPLAVLDWMMPEMDGLEVCRRIRATQTDRSVYLILLTAKGKKEDIVAGLQAGADDYLTKPFDHGELYARIRVGERTLDIQTRLADRVKELEEAISRVKQLQSLLPICCYCKKVRDDNDYWCQVESYLSVHADVRFSHGICPGCMASVVQRELDEHAASQAKSS